jgi:hypothetical protein
MSRYHAIVLSLTSLLGPTIAADASSHPFVYDCVGGIVMSYDGDLVTGTLIFESIPGQGFRVQRPDFGWVLGEFGIAGAQFHATFDLIEFHDSGDPSGDGDWAEFAGTMTIQDEYGSIMTAATATFRIDDHSNGFMPSLEGQGAFLDATFTDGSMPGTFQTIPTHCLGDGGTIFTFSFLAAEETLQSLMQVGDFSLELDSLEVRVSSTFLDGDLDLDGVVGLADLGLLLASYEIDDGADINGDGVTDLADLGILLGEYGQHCE